MAHEQFLKTTSQVTVDAKGGEFAREITMIMSPLQGSQGIDHFAPPRQTGSARIGAKFTPARKPHDDHGSQYEQENLGYHLGDVVRWAITQMVAQIFLSILATMIVMWYAGP